MKTKAANEVLDYVEDYSAEMAATSPNDTISTSVFTADNGVTIGDSSSPQNTYTNTTTTATVWLSGGRNYTYANVTNTITTAAGRTFIRTQIIEIKPQICT